MLMLIFIRVQFVKPINDGYEAVNYNKKKEPVLDSDTYLDYDI